MEELKYKVIKTEQQYQEYCTVLEGLVDRSDVSAQDEIELLTYLIEKWDEEHEALSLADPIELLSSLMKDRSIKAKDLVEILGVSKGLVSDILHYKKGLSKEVIRTLASYFKVSQEAFNRPYKLKVSENSHLKNASVINTTKELNVA
ncbi:helix-turn-helix domain-containing protein [Siphonobacter sp. SORGH_AS_0500]|uniref:helix-turn-helix domain-containing protein n=1 Tax=Siphonobacter sp. SORGH_AS_0500 TaxID=1864824 RepID=UPI00285E85C2|nr:helix-turn-helix domain-containing protein [Siphonobacter sp. SORGH_AS_0500]MDR6198064.1 HTH-type transcriptional regulator/antitoxin HigA [Siphonobacter sp. SORGH_AS_0500]